MTVSGSAVCNVIQAFPVLLILAQNANKCLKTPLIYKPPSPTHTPEYYEAYDALLHSLLHDNKCSPYKKPCQPSYPETGYGYGYPHGYAFEKYPSFESYPDGYIGYTHNGYRVANGYNMSTNYLYKTNYAPTQVYNTKHKHKVIVVKHRGHNRFERLRGFLPQRNDRRISPASPFGFFQNVIPDRNRIRNTLSGILHFHPGNGNGAYVINNSPTNDQYQTNRPFNDQYETNRQNNDQYNNRPKPVRFPDQDIPNDSVNFEPQTTTSNEVNQPIENPAFIENHNSNFGGLISGTVGTPKSEEYDNVAFGNNPTFGNRNGENDGAFNSADFNHNSDFGGLISGTVDTSKSGDYDNVAFGNNPAFGNRNGENNGAFNSAARNIEDTCETIEGGKGNCISLKLCEPYLKLVSQARNDVKSRMILQRSHCGFEENVPKVCCPLPGIPSELPGIPTAPPTLAPVMTMATQAPTEKQPDVISKAVEPSDYVTAFPEPPVCGVSSGSFGKVVGGVDAKLGDFPWIALLGYQNQRDSTTRWRCGGSLITAHHVLTAAHCIHNHEDELYVVRLGELDLTRDDDGASPIDVLIKSKIKHEQYNSASFENDIGVLVLQQFVEFTNLISPICLPFQSDMRSQKFERLTPMIAGWGDVQFRGPSANHLQVVQLPVQTNEVCTKAYAKYPKQIIDSRVLCAGYKEGGKDACQGDSGGPLMLPNWNNVTYKVYFYQIGVVSYGKNCAEAGFPGVYSRTTHFMPWLEKIVLGV